MSKLKLNLTRRWVRARPGSVLILVIALLVLLALIGTAYLSSTQTERYTAHQNSVNVQADMLIEGLQVSVQSAVVNGVYGAGSNGQEYRPPAQEMPGINTQAPAAGAYTTDVSTAVDPALTASDQVPNLFLAERIPTLPPAASGNPAWNSISFPLFTDSSGDYTFDSPFEASANAYAGVNKGNIIAVPTYRKMSDGNIYPAMYLGVRGGKLQTSAGSIATNYVSPVNSTFGTAIFAVSASGDGIADAGLFKLPVGQLNGVTYYGAIRVVDNNSAINASTAWNNTSDSAITALTEPLPAVTPATRNYGFFRSNVGLKDLLWAGDADSELNKLNAYRFNGTLPSPSVAGNPTLGPKPVGDDQAERADFEWYSAGDALEQQLARRPGNPGYSNPKPSSTNFAWLGLNESAALAYKFSLRNPNASPGIIEQCLVQETQSAVVRTTPYSPAQVSGINAGLPVTSTGYWFGDLFNFSPATNMPVRTIVTCSNPVSNAVPSRLGNTNTTSPVAWSATAPYEFGDCVIASNGFTYSCLLHNSGQNPTAALTASPEYWTLMPFTKQAVKTSINTASFNQLWLGFCQAMTDSITKSATPGAIPQWQPPMLPLADQANYPESQLPMFRSTIRDNRTWPVANTGNTGNPVSSPTSTSRVQMTPMQQMQLRAALAAINTLGMRNANANLAQDIVRSHHITLADNTGAPTYDVEVFNSGVQPYIGQMYAEVLDDGTGTSKNFVAIQLLNPYPVAIPVTTSWGFASLDRTLTAAMPKLLLTSLLTAPIVPFNIPAATTTGPASIVIYDGTPPGYFTMPATAQKLPGLIQALGKELVILKPRLLTGAPSSQTGSAADTYDEGPAATPNLYDLVPVDQIDLTGATQVTFPGYLLYKRAANPALTGPNNGTYAWNFVWPGFYTPYNSYNPNAAVKTGPAYTPAAALPLTTYPFSQPILNLTAAPTAATLDFTALTGGPTDTTGAAVASPTYNTVTLQVNNVGFPGTNPIGSAPDKFPFGGFARTADMLQIPFIGAYRICGYGVSAATGFYEMNSVTMDSSLANDSTLQPSIVNTNYSTKYPSLKVLPSSNGYATVTPAVTITADSFSDPYVEQIGRFCPVGNPSSTVPTEALDFGPGYDPASTTKEKVDWHYHWTHRLFDYFTVQAPHDDYFPNVDPAGPDATALPIIAAKFPGATGIPAIGSSTVVGVNNAQSTAYNDPRYYANALTKLKSEDTVGVEGLININTAPWPVLARLPFVAKGTDNLTFNDQTGVMAPALPATATMTPLGAVANGVDDNIDIAKAIVYYRNANGPFHNLTDLYKVPAFRLENEFLLATDPSSLTGTGDFSGGPTSTPGAPTVDQIRFDFEERFLLLNNVSNLITTRSDTFTCYVLLQGWRNVGTATPTLVVQRRAAFLVDRNAVTPSSNQPDVFKVPTD